MNKFLFTLILAIAPPGIVFAGAINGGGGVGVICRDIQGKVTQATVLDLYESVQSGFRLREASGDVLKDFTGFLIEARRTTQDPRLYAIPEDEAFFKDFMGRAKFGPGPIPYSDDLGSLPFFLPANCRLEQIAVFRDDLYTLFIDQDLWKELDSFAQAALITHEWIYWYSRQAINPTSSIKTRAIVAALAAVTPPKGSFADAKQGEAYICSASASESSSRTRFLVYPDPDNKDKSRVQIVSYFGFDNYFLNRYTIDAIDVAKLVPIDLPGAGKVLNVANPKATQDPLLYLGRDMLVAEKFSIEHTHGKPFAISRLSEGHEVVERAYVRDCHIWKWVIP